MSTPLGVIWDLDGVLVDTGEQHYQAWRSVAAELGVELTREQFVQTFGMRNSDIIRRLFHEDRPWRARQIADRKEERYREQVVRGIDPAPGVAELLESLRRCGAEQAVATSAPLENIRVILETADINHYFSAVVADEDVSHGKPDPEPFRLAADRLGIPPAACVVIEDAPAGLQAAGAAGMACVAVASSHPAAELRSADLVVDSLTRLTADQLYQLARQPVMRLHVPA